jgi:asparagine synthase (glutamine-hydrolysing)
MCGICGVALADRSRHVAPSQLARMCDVLAHRGPDDAGLRVFGHVGFGHRRLSIVDLAGGHQPMANEDGSVWVTYNGEIYNHAEFRPRLAARGHRYRTRCDTEAILHLYEEDGEGLAAALRGMFAFAVWDRRQQTVLLVRDHYGIKPLYYALTAARDLVFGSELKALFASGMVEPVVDAGALPQYFATGHVAGGRTLYREVHELPSGEFLVWHDGVVRRGRYANAARASLGSPAESRLTLQDAGRAFWTRFRESVRLQLMSDVPLGVFLSGGIDSSLIVAAMRECGVGRLMTFSVGFADRSANELPMARTVATAFATEHRDVVVTPESFFEALSALTWHRDLPLTFPASVPLYFVSRLAATAVKVVLTGEGSDELFAGYGRYARGMWNLRLAAGLDRWLPRAARTWLAAAAARAGNGYVGSRVKRSFLARRGHFATAYLDVFSEVAAEHRQRLLRAGALEAEDAYGDTLRYLDRTLLRENPLEAILRLDQATYLQELLAKQDRMSMAASLESRVPYLDQGLAQWAGALPPALKLCGTTGKALLRAAAVGLLPAAVAQAPKRGFPVPLRHWLRGPGRGWLEEYAPRAGDELLDAGYVRRLITEHGNGRDWAGPLWRILAFQVWRRDAVARARALHAAASAAIQRCSAT